jgi:hypothetical protein
MSEEPVEYETRTIKVLVGVKGEPLYNELGFVVEITDEGGGEFVEVYSAIRESGEGNLRIDAARWPALRDAIDKMLKECREDA